MSAVPALIAGWLDTLDSGGRLALIKLVTGGLRVGVSARLARVALAEWSGQAVEEIEEAWHGVAPPYVPLFRWLERVQLTAGPGGKRLWSRGGEDISAAFPEILAAMDFHAVLDGELLVVRDGEVAPFADLQQRLNRKAVTAKMQRDYPAAVRLYDLLFDAQEDLRSLPFDARRARLESWHGRVSPPRMDLSALVPFDSIGTLARMRDGARAASIEGLMLKRADAPYVAGRTKGPWCKWKRDPYLIDAVLMYAQRGHGKRSSFYSDYTFGVWTHAPDGARMLTPVGKAYFGFTDEELRWLDKWVRDHTTNRFGPVREVAPELVLEIAFDGIARSTRHRSGVAMRFPRINRIRTDKPAAEADTVEALVRLVPAAV